MQKRERERLTSVEELVMCAGPPSDSPMYHIRWDKEIAIPVDILWSNTWVEVEGSVDSSEDSLQQHYFKPYFKKQNRTGKIWIRKVLFYFRELLDHLITN